mgnify:CR=1 FL=1
MGLIWEKSFWVFFILTVIIGGGAAFATGRALALKWRPFREVIVYACLLGLADRFLHWGLFLDRPLDVYKGTITSLHYYAVDTAVLIAIAVIAYRSTQAKCMTSQYPWMYERTGPFNWRKKTIQDE